MTASMTEMWTQVGSSMAGIMFVWAMFQQYFPYDLRKHFQYYCHRLIAFFSPYIVITFHEYTADRFRRSNAYQAIETYLGVNSSSHAKRFKAEQVKDSQSVVLSMDEYEEVTDEFHGIKLWWTSSKTVAKTQTISFYPSDDKRYYKLTFHRRHRKMVTEAYLEYVLKEGKSITIKNRQRKLFTNCKNDDGWRGGGSLWSHVVFEHPATFDTLAMEENRKKDIMSDLMTFSKSKDYYKKIGKAWKRGYLLYGPPGTGKSTMIAAMANLLEYDIYDLELTSVKDNTELRKLLIGTSSKSIMVIEDIDCSLDLTGQRKKEKKDEKDEKDEKDLIKKAVGEGGKNKSSEVTLSGLLNFIDGLWSSCGGERIIVFTTNYIEKLDPALIRRGRMDKRIELSYCCFEAFKVLAKNYLDVEEHDLFESIKRALEETEMTPADVGENLMPKCAEEDAETCLNRLIQALAKAKEDARVKAEEEAKAKIEAEEKAKAEKEKEGAEASDKKEEEKKSVADKQVKENGVADTA